MLYSSDTRSLNISEHRRFNLLSGLRALFDDGSFIEILGGAESNKQITLESPGAIATVNARLNSLDLDGYKVNSTLKSEFLRLNNSRLNSDFDLRLNVEKSYDAADNIKIIGRYKTMGRNFLSSFGGSSADNMQIETRLENRLGIDALLNFGIAGNLQGRTALSVERLSVERSYKTFFTATPQTGVVRNLNELQLGFSLEGIYQTANFLNISGFAINHRDEENVISRKFDISDIELQKLRAMENQRDNVSSRNRLYSRTIWQASKKDTVRFNGQMSLLRYDTPSPENNDDRDEFYLNASAEYSRMFSSELSANLQFETQLSHFVYLKAARSALNYWNRIIRFSPGVNFSTPLIKMSPQFEILANYSVYDFEEKGVSPKSYSFRQISFKDSIIVFLGKNISLQTKYLFRYFERGILYWKTFSETPQNSNFEKFIKILAVTEMFDGLTAGFGGRHYQLSQRNLNVLPTARTGTEIIQNSLGPEAVLVGRFSSGSEISVNGWYEFQFLKNNEIRKMPNIFINTLIKF